MAKRKQRKMIQIADPDLFAKTKDVLVKFGEHLDGSRTITETRALAIMIRTAASFYGTGERLMLGELGRHKIAYRANCRSVGR